ncbi:hypothetical protein GWK47_011517 [Chionoecetes opilio]|uniref:Uncharacterized protein n=1 Tax=Chionoecetes opilio TaxID=41210 RepID=A0A8J5C2K0_CHIOP|nr:hypothetical protein GWK47_011517 [Chionoecetes opilio]
MPLKHYKMPNIWYMEICPSCPVHLISVACGATKTLYHYHTPPCGFSPRTPQGPRGIARPTQQGIRDPWASQVYEAGGEVLMMVQCMTGRAVKVPPGDL